MRKWENYMHLNWNMDQPHTFDCDPDPDLQLENIKTSQNSPFESKLLKNSQELVLILSCFPLQRMNNTSIYRKVWVKIEKSLHRTSNHQLVWKNEKTTIKFSNANGWGKPNKSSPSRSHELTRQNWRQNSPYQLHFDRTNVCPLSQPWLTYLRHSCQCELCSTPTTFSPRHL